MSFLDDFHIEAQELLDSAEEGLLGMEGDESEFHERYNSVFRAFHSLKGAAGMMDMQTLQKHMHLMEDSFQSIGENQEEFKDSIDRFLEGVDSARSLLEGETVELFAEKQANNLKVLSEKEKSASLPTDVVTQEVCFEYTSHERYRVCVLSEAFSRSALKVDLEKKVVFVIEQDIKKFFSRRSYLNFDAIIIDNNCIELVRKENFPCMVWAEKPLNPELKCQIARLSDSSSIEYVLEGCRLNSLSIKPMRFFDQAIRMLIYQFNDVEEFLIQKDKKAMISSIKSEISMLLKSRRECLK